MNTGTNDHSLGSDLKAAFENEGLVFLGVTGLDCERDYQKFSEWVRRGHHGSMAFLERHHSIRRDPSKLLPGARSVAVAALPYYQPENQSLPRVAQYARYPDYHRVLRRKLEAAALQCLSKTQFRAVADSAPILERALAARTARGFIGKNTLFIHPERGSFLLLGELLCTEALAVDTPVEIPLDKKTRDGGCGPCRLCQSACPTGALNRDYSLDATKCLSYWTIEHRGPIPERFWPHLEEYYFGCDLCQLACPYNKHAQGPPSDFETRSFPSVDQVAQMDQGQYETWFGGTPLTRAKRHGLRRNALIALAVTQHPALERALAAIDGDSEPVLEATREQIRNWRKSKDGL